MTTVLDLLLIWAIWLLVTADLSWVNVLIGLAIALLFAKKQQQVTPWKDILRLLGKIAIAIPKAYLEAFEMILWPHHQEVITVVSGLPHPSSEVVFLEIFLITFTPKTIVLDQTDGGYDVHQVQRS